jgi:small subunit ribosomal protein S9
LSDEETQDEGQTEDPEGAPEPVPAEDPPADVPDEADVGPSAPPEATPEDAGSDDEPLAESHEADPAPAEEVPAEESDEPEEQAAPPDEAPTEEPVTESTTEESAAEAPAEAPPGEERPAKPAAEPKAKDVAPGADLEPLLIEDERELSAEERARLEAEREEAEQAAAAESDVVVDEPALREGATLDLPEGSRIQATGKRKTAIARVVVTKGGGEFLVNRKSIEDYFPRDLHQTIARQAITTSGYDSQVDVKVRVHGGGVSGQADAVRHATARALIEIDPELRGELKRRGMLTRDAREKERRKAGFKKARKKPQFSKR